MIKSILLLFLSGILMSCNTKTDRLQFSKFEIKDENGITRIKVDGNGTIEMSDKKVGTINPDGTLNDKNGKLIAELSENGMLKYKDGNNLSKITPNGQIDNGSGTFIEWSETGELINGTESTGMKISPVDKKSFQTASMILFLYLNLKK